MNIVNDLDTKSDDTIATASAKDFEKLYDVAKVIDPATTRQTRALTADLAAVSSNILGSCFCLCRRFLPIVEPSP
jgi:hypothetical protein